VDGNRFDALARALAAPGTRRRLLAGLAAAALGAVGRRGAEAVACRMPGELCREHADCCSRLCSPKDAIGRRCACRAVGDCPTAAVCHAVACTAGACVASVLLDGTACTAFGGAAGTCRGGRCAVPTTTTTTTTSTSTSTTTGTTTSTTTPSPTCPYPVSVIPGPPTQATVTVQDTGSGIVSLVLTQSENADTPVPPFTPGTTEPITVTATKIDQSQSAQVTLVATNGAGTVTTCEVEF
jgi:hypothetical protein